MKTYICECGKEFDNPQKFNGHKCHCLIHREVTKTTDFYKEVIKNASIKRNKTLKETAEKRKFLVLEKWISEKHICEKCGKIMTEKYGSGRFCSRACANSKSHSVETKEKIKLSLVNNLERKNNITIKHLNAEKEYYKNPATCKICGKILSYKKRKNKTCCKVCRAKYLSLIESKVLKEIRGPYIKGRHIVYKTIFIPDGRYYIGVRKTENSAFDGYYGSGKILKAMLKKYGKENFIRQTLFEFDNSTDAFNKEHELLVKQNLLNDPLNINIADGGQGGGTFKGKHHSEKSKLKISKANSGKHHSAETKQKISTKNKGRHHTELAKEKIRQYRLSIHDKK